MILAVLAIMVFIVFEAAPLFAPASATRVSAATPGAQTAPQALAMDEYRAVAYGIWEEPEVRLFEPSTGHLIEAVPLDSVSGARITAADCSRTGDRPALGTSDGRVLLVTVDFSVEFDAAGSRTSRATVEERAVLTHTGAAASIRAVSHAFWEGGSATAALAEDGRVLLWSERIVTSLLGDETRSVAFHEIPVDVGSADPGAPTALALANDGTRLFVGFGGGDIQFWDLRGSTPALHETLNRRSTSGKAVTALALAAGDRTLIVGDAVGDLSAWFEVTDPIAGGNAKHHRRVHEFRSHQAPIVQIRPSSRDRGFLSLDQRGTVRLQYLTTERVLLDIKLASGGSALSFAPKADGFLAGCTDGSVSHYAIRNPHPEISLKALFGKIWYEGYDKPAFVWQSTGGTDDFEGKFSLVPLIFGTIKGTVYALLFAVPIALMAAIYASQFLHYKIRNALKPTIEIMAALPSVVLGLIAGLFLAPVMENKVPGTLLSVIVLPILFLGCAIAWRAAPVKLTSRFPAGTEVLLLIPVVLIGWGLAQALGPVVERGFFGGDFRHWLGDTASVRYDQRNCLVVGFAMGFAVIPIIFTICEDSLTAVPQHLISGSIACGASRWQTALRIVLPAAGSGIFSAIMVGFGRAVGETMIVLMATGNTPIIDWSIFNGMRTLSANIATEVPEAPYRGTLYRILFFSGLLLFTLTFLLNTAAEMIRQRLRRKFGNY